MDYAHTRIDGKDTVLVDIKNFNLEQTLNCGQAFRFSGSGNFFSGIAHGRRLEVVLLDGNLILKEVSLEEYENLWKDYFGLNVHYDELKKRFSRDKSLQKALEFSPGLRVMRQDPWETLITFIISQNNNIPRIKGIVERLCELFGKPLPCGGRTFPGPDVIAALSPEALAPLRSGYRAKYITDAAYLVAGGVLKLNKLYKLDSESMQKELLQIKGVGPKVAECVMLYGFGRVERFPLDVWMKRVMASLYPNGFPDNLKDIAGIAQQFLFHYARTSSEFLA